MDDGDSSHRPRGPRLYHKKSRTGCARCKQRRVKCDETRPSCGGCSRHLVECVYPSQATSSISPPGPAPSSSTRARTRAYADATSLDAERSDGMTPSPPNTENSNTYAHAHTPGSMGTQPSPDYSYPDAVEGRGEVDLDLPESRGRRIWELRLLHNSLTMAHPFPALQQGPAMRQLFHVDVPLMALKGGSDLLLYGLLAHSALNMMPSGPTPKEREVLEVLHQSYLSLLLREQRRDVSRLGPENADRICFSSLRILTHAMALVQTLPMNPWEPPIEWLRMGRGAGAVFVIARDIVIEEEENKFKTFLKAPGVSEDPGETIFSDHSALDWLLDHPAGPGSAEAKADTELVDEETKRIYDMAMSYTCSSQRAIESGEPNYAIGRRLGGFSVWIPTEFTQFLIERRPRAMVILAHFMALWLNYEDAWIIGKAGERQIRGIHKSLPLEWSSKLDELFAKFKTPRSR